MTTSLLWCAYDQVVLYEKPAPIICFNKETLKMKKIVFLVLFSGTIHFCLLFLFYHEYGTGFLYHAIITQSIKTADMLIDYI